MSKLKRLSLIVLAVTVVPVAAYSTARQTYFWQWWGRDNLVLRSLWLCSAPPELEQSFYPENVEVLVPACENYHPDSYSNGYSFTPEYPSSTGVLLPSGKYLFVGKRLNFQPYLLDLQTKQKTELIDYERWKGINYWLTDELGLNRERSPNPTGSGYLYSYTLIDLSNGNEVELSASDLDSNKDSQMSVVEGLQNGYRVFVSSYPRPKEYQEFYSDHIEYMIVVGIDVWQDSEGSFMISTQASRMQELISLLEEKEIDYSYMSGPCLGSGIISPDKNYIAAYDGIYEFSSNLQIVDYPLFGTEVSFQPCAWLSDSRSVILSSLPKIYYAVDFTDDFGLFAVPQPILKLSLPK